MQNVCPVKHKFASRYQDESMLDLRSRPRPRLPLQASLILIEIIPLNCTLNLRHFLLLNILKIVILFTRKKNTKLSQFVSFYISSPMTSLIVAIMLKINPENEQKTIYRIRISADRKKEWKEIEQIDKERKREWEQGSRVRSILGVIIFYIHKSLCNKTCWYKT